MDLKIGLTYAQEFELKKYRDSLKTLTEAEKDEIIIQLSRQLFVKGNLVKQFMKKIVERESDGMQEWLKANKKSE